MAEYRALAQNTQKFVTEVTLHNAGDVTQPTAPRIGQLKVLTDNESKVVYASLSPIINNYFAARENGISEVSVQNSAENPNVGAVYLYQVLNTAFNNSTLLDTVGGCTRATVDGVDYYGLKSGSFYVYPRASDGDKGKTPAIIPRIVIPTVKAKVVLYNACTKTIVGNEYDCSGLSMSDLVYSGTVSSSYYGYMYRFGLFNIQKGNHDLVLAVDFEYPKYNITMSGSGLDYSLDDGLTFRTLDGSADIPEAIEHIIVRNNSKVIVNIGTAAGNFDVTQLGVGATKVIVPNADGNWFVRRYGEV